MKGIMLGGLGRSGTSLLRDLFVANPHAISFGKAESKLFVEPYGLLDLYRALVTDFTYARGLTALHEFRVLSTDHMLDSAFTGQPSLMEGRPYEQVAQYKAAISRFISSCTEEDVPLYLSEDAFFARARSLIVDICLALGSTSADFSFVEKTPHNALNPAFFKRIFDPLHCVWLIRDPRAVAYSTLKQDWGPTTLLAACSYTRQVVRRYVEVRDQVPCLEMRLEDMANDLSSFISKVESYCEFGLAPEHVQVDPAIINDWKLRLVGEELAAVTVALAPEIEVLGYRVDVC